MTASGQRMRSAIAVVNRWFVQEPLQRRKSSTQIVLYILPLPQQDLGGGRQQDNVSSISSRHSTSFAWPAVCIGAVHSVI